MRRPWCLLALLLLSAPIARAAEGTLTVASIGAHAGTVIEAAAGRIYVIDPGHKSAREKIAPYLRSVARGGRGTATIDGIIITHPHLDHFAGVPFLLRQFRVGRLLDTSYTKHADPR